MKRQSLRVMLVVCSFGLFAAIPNVAVARQVGACEGSLVPRQVGGQVVTVAGNRIEVPTSTYELCIFVPDARDYEGNPENPYVEPFTYSDGCGASQCSYLDMYHNLAGYATVTIGYSTAVGQDELNFTVPLVPQNFDAVCLMAQGADATSQDCIVGIEE